MVKNRTSVVLSPKEREDIEFIKEAGDLDSNSSAIRYAIRRVARLMRRKLEQAKQKKG